MQKQELEAIFRSMLGIRRFDEGVMELSKTLAIAFRVRQQMPGTISSKFEYLVIDNVIAAGELDLARVAQQLAAGAQHDRQLAGVDVKAFDQRLRLRIGLGVQPLTRMAVAC